MSNGLTQKQEKFAVAYVRLGNGVAAYREAYDAAGSNDAVAANKASLLLKRDDIRVRIAELTKPAAEAAGLVAKLTRQHIAAAAYSQPEEPIKWADKLNALDKAAKIDGLYKPENTTAPTNITVEVVVVAAPGVPR